MRAADDVRRPVHSFELPILNCPVVGRGGGSHRDNKIYPNLASAFGRTGSPKVQYVLPHQKLY